MRNVTKKEVIRMVRRLNKEELKKLYCLLQGFELARDVKDQIHSSWCVHKLMTFTIFSSSKTS